MAERGIGLGYNGIFISLHENYPSYAKLRDWLRQFTWLDPSEVQSFLVNLNDDIRYLPSTFAGLANYFTELRKKEA